MESGLLQSRPAKRGEGWPAFRQALRLTSFSWRSHFRLVPVREISRRTKLSLNLTYGALLITSRYKRRGACLVHKQTTFRIAASA